MKEQRRREIWKEQGMAEINVSKRTVKGQITDALPLSTEHTAINGMN